MTDRRVGHPRRLLPFAQARLPLYAGIDLGGTTIKASLVDDLGRTLAFHTEPTHADRGPDDAAARMGHAVHTLAGMVGIVTSDIAAVGLGTPGPQDLPTGLIIRAGNLPGWDNYPIRDRVAVHCGHPVSYANDATAAAYGLTTQAGLGSVITLFAGVLLVPIGLASAAVAGALLYFARRAATAPPGP